MPTQKARMLRGEPYDPRDPQLVAERRQARRQFKVFNDSPEEDGEGRRRALRQLLPNAGRKLWVEPPFHCDYGGNIRLGDEVYFNFNCVVLDVCPVVIGSRVLFGPAVQIYTATHSLDPVERGRGLEWGKPVVIGDDVWVGGGTVICPGVTIGPRTVVGAGSVVTRDLPADVVAAGNPCRVLRPLEAPAGEGRGPQAAPGSAGPAAADGADLLAVFPK